MARNMERRDFLKKAGAVVAVAAVAPHALKADDGFMASQAENTDRVDDFEITSDEVRDGIRYVTAKTSAKVCSSSFELQIRQKGNILLSYVCIKGCPGNSIGVGRLVKGMKVKDVISTLSGTLCGKRGTSCPDQLARILEALK